MVSMKTRIPTLRKDDPAPVLTMAEQDTALQLASTQNRLDSLLSSEFTGCAEGPRDLASEFKQHFASDLAAKHGLG